MRRSTSVLAVLALLLGVGVVGAQHPGAADAKVKKCKSGYYRENKKCKKLLIIKPTKIVIVAGKLRDGKFGATGYAEFPKTERRGVLKGYFQLFNGIGRERVSFRLEVPKGLNYSNFTTNQRKVGITGETVTAELVIQGTRSPAFTLKK